MRDAVGYGFYFLSYEWSKRLLAMPEDSERVKAAKVLLCGGFAGVVTWASVFPLDVVKTRVQTQPLPSSALTAIGGTHDRQPLLDNRRNLAETTKLRGAFEIARQTYANEGLRVFFRGLGVCSLRAFVVNAVQWTVYEWMMRLLTSNTQVDGREGSVTRVMQA